MRIIYILAFFPIITICVDREAEYSQLNILSLPITPNYDETAECSAAVSKVLINLKSKETNDLLMFSGLGLNQLGLITECMREAKMEETSNIYYPYRYITISLEPTPLFTNAIGICIPNACTKNIFAPLKPLFFKYFIDKMKVIFEQADAYLLYESLYAKYTTENIEMRDISRLTEEKLGIQATFLLSCFALGAVLIWAVFSTIVDKFKREQYIDRGIMELEGMVESDIMGLMVNGKRRLTNSSIESTSILDISWTPHASTQIHNHSHNNRRTTRGTQIIYIYIYILEEYEYHGQYIPHTTFQKICACCSITRNWTQLFTPYNKIDSNLNILNGIRVLTLFWALFSLTFIYNTRTPILNIQQTLRMGREFIFSMIAPGGRFCIDIFLFLSGFLNTTYLFRTLHNKNKLSVWRIILHRYIQLTSTVIIIFLLFSSILSNSGNGPIYFSYADTMCTNCRQTFYTFFLYISNLYSLISPNCPFYSSCLNWLWPISNIFQFNLLSIPLVVLYFRNKKYGAIVLGVIFISALLAQGAIGSIYNYTVNPMEYKRELIPEFLALPYVNISSYIVGIFFSMLYSHQLFRIPGYELRICSKILRSWGTRIFGYVVSVLIILLALLGIGLISKFVKVDGAVGSAMYFVISKTLLLFALGYLLLCGTMDQGKPLLRFLCARFWCSLSKMTYSAYMSFGLFITYVIYTTKAPIYYDYKVCTVHTFAYILLSFSMSFLIEIFFRLPTGNIEKRFLTDKWRNRKIHNININNAANRERSAHEDVELAPRRNISSMESSTLILDNSVESINNKHPDRSKVNNESHELDRIFIYHNGEGTLQRKPSST